MRSRVMTLSQPNLPSAIFHFDFQTMTRSHKLNSRGHPADGTMIPQDQLSRHPAKSVPTDVNPRKTKKDGGGKGNWGRSGDEVQDCAYTLNNARRRSNSSSQGLADFHTKFETVEPEPVFDEQIHGRSDGPVVDANAVVKVESGTSSNDGETDQADVKY